MARSHCTGAGFLDALRSAVANLEANVDEINALNVFPVPDGDTGTNMLATVRAALDEAETVGRDAPAERIAAAVSHGALMGARGNSGVITSQILRGVAEGLAGQATLQRARPRECPDARHPDRVRRGRQAGRGNDPHGHPRVVGGRGRGGRARRRDGARPGRDRRRGPEVGRADAVAPADPPRGGRRRLGRPGPVPAVRGRPAERPGPAGPRRRRHAGWPLRTPRTAAPPRRRSGPASPRSRTTPSATRRSSSSPRRRTRASTFRRSRPTSSRSATRSSSAATRRMVKVHVHNERPDEVIAYGLSLGTLTRITVENLDTMADDVREARARGVRRRGRRAGAAAGPATSTAVATKAATAVAVQPAASAAPTRTVAGRPSGADRQRRAARLPGLRGHRWRRPGARARDRRRRRRRGLEKLFRDFGVAHVLRGGQTANPSTGRAAPDRPPRPVPRGDPPPEQPERPPRGRAGGPDLRGPPARRRPDPERGRGRRRAARLRSGRRRGRERRADDGRRARPRDGPGDRGRPRREDRRRQGQEGPDDRPRPGRRARRGRRATATAPC